MFQLRNSNCFKELSEFEINNKDTRTWHYDVVLNLMAHVHSEDSELRFCAGPRTTSIGPRWK